VLALPLLLSCDGESPGDADGGPPPPPPYSGPCVAPHPPNSDASIMLVEAFEALPTLDQPLYMVESPTEGGRFYVVEKTGRVVTFTGDGADASTWADFTADVVTDSESGLLFLAFDPEYASNQHVYLTYITQPGADLLWRVSRFTAPPGGPLDRASEEILLELVKPSFNHNGGSLAFGPDDGYLYISLGDGGSGIDDGRLGQDTESLYGSVLRIDVRSGETPYSIPEDNPFVDGGGRPEIWAYGLRNPWRMHFDRLTGELWLGDVGEGVVEEVDIVRRGANYGWNEVEGDECFWRFPDCDPSAFEAPVATYRHDEGDLSITGGFVYRGTDIPELRGVYIHGGFASGRIRGLYEREDATFESRLLLETDLSIASFGRDRAGELYVVGFSSGRLMRIAPAGAPGPSDFPTRLSETGCMDPDDPSRPHPSLIPYAPSATLWSDGAGKERWLSLPEDTTITVTADGDFEPPLGTVLVKQFRRDGRLLETRLYMRHPSGDWGGYTYRWNDAQTEAVLLEDAGEVVVDGRPWAIPSRAECNQCHTEAAGRSLGLEVAQLDHDFTYPESFRVSGTRNQLEVLRMLGVLEEPVPEVAPLPRYDDDAAPVAARARAYLHSNCSSCHRPGAPNRTDLDLRATTALADTGLCAPAALEDFDRPGIRVVEPGDPSASVLSLRMRTLGEPRMPRIGSHEVDEAGTALIDEWITALASCP